MLNSINKRILYRSSNLEVAGYAQEVVLATESLDAVTEVAPYVEALKSAVTNYNDVLYMKSTGEITAKINQINAKVVSAWYSIMKITDGLTYFPIAEVQKAGEEIYGLVSHFGNIAYVSNDYRYGSVVSFLAKVTDEQAKLAGIDTLVDILREGNSEYVLASAERKDFRRARKAKLKEARKAMEKWMSLLFDAVVNLAAVQGEDKFLSFVDRVDELRIERADKTKKQTVKAAQTSEGEQADESDGTADVPETLDADLQEDEGLEQEPKDPAEPDN